MPCAIGKAQRQAPNRFSKPPAGSGACAPGSTLLSAALDCGSGFALAGVSDLTAGRSLSQLLLGPGILKSTLALAEDHRGDLPSTSQLLPSPPLSLNQPVWPPQQRARV